MSRKNERSARMQALSTSLQHYGLTAAEIAQVVGASPGTQTAWIGGRPTPDAVAGRLDRLHEIAFLLADTLGQDQVGAWFRRNNRILRGYTPLEMVALHAYDQVLAAAAAVADGLEP